MAEKQTVEDGKPPEVKHPLMAATPRIIHDFEAWYERWQQTDWYADKLGLLHALTADAGWWNEPNLVFTLLEIADGFDRESNFSSDTRTDGYGDRNQTAENRQSVAKKAFTVLCSKFFGAGKSRDYQPQWWWMLQHDVLFQKALWFLRREKDHLGRMRNRADEGRGEAESHYREVYQKFLFDFAKLGWLKRWPQGEDRCSRWDEATEKLVCQRLLAARPQFIEILGELRQLFWLEAEEAELDDETVKLLTKRALNQELYLPKQTASYVGDMEYRKAVSLEEALLANSAASEIVILHGIRAKEQKRIAGLVEQNRKRNEQERKDRQLADLARQKEQLRAQEERLKGGKP